MGFFGDPDCFSVCVQRRISPDLCAGAGTSVPRRNAGHCGGHSCADCRLDLGRDRPSLESANEWTTGGIVRSKEKARHEGLSQRASVFCNLGRLLNLMRSPLSLLQMARLLALSPAWPSSLSFSTLSQAIPALLARRHRQCASRRERSACSHRDDL